MRRLMSIRAACFTAAALLLGAPAFAQDAITVGTMSATAGGTFSVPVYVRDVSGTLLGSDAASGRKIQGIAFRVNFNAASVTSISFARDGILTGLTPVYERTISATGSIAYIGDFDESTAPIPFTTSAAPGQQIGTLTVTLASSIAAHSVPLTLDPAVTILSNTAGTATETPSNGLQLNSGLLALSAEVSIAATDAVAGETGINTGTFTITRTGSTASPLTVNFTIGGTATNGGDYSTISTPVTIDAGSSSTTVTITPIDDSTNEPTETVILTITSGSGYDIGTPSSATVTITSNDVNSPPSITAGTQVTRSMGGVATTAVIATVTDTETPAGALVVTADNTFPLFISNIVNNNGTVSALVSANCSGTAGTYTANVRVTDADGSFAIATFRVTVTANAVPTVGNYPNIVTHPGVAVTNLPDSPPADNGTVSFSVSAPGFTGFFTTTATTGSIVINNPGPVGSYTVTVTVSDNCFTSTTRTFILNVLRPGTAGDFNGDGKSDIVWRSSTTGQSSVWLMNGASVNNGSGVTNLQFGDNSFTVAGTGDFNGDGNADIIWRNKTSGDTFVWAMNGINAVAGSGQIATVPPPWQIVGVGDFNGDSKSDLLWRNSTTGQNSIWLMNGVSVLSGSGEILANPDPAWKVGGIGDFNNDGRSDILWRNDAAGADSIWLMNGLSIQNGSGSTNLQIGSAWRASGVGDFNGDGYADILWRNTSTGDNIIWLQNGLNTIAGSGATNPVSDVTWTAVGVGDFNGDSKADILWRNDSTGGTSIWIMNGTVVSAGSGTLATTPPPWQIVAPH
jgi:hypothetical protein